MHKMLDLVPYQFVRPPSEYQAHFRESEVMAKYAREYGFSNVAIEDYPTGQTNSAGRPARNCGSPHRRTSTMFDIPR